MEAAVFTEATTVLRDWLRTLLDTADLWAGGMPRNATDGIVVTRIGGDFVSPLDQGLYQFDCWATTAPAAAALASGLVTALDAAPPQTISDTVRFCGCGPVNVTTLSDPDAPDRYRTVVTAVLPTLTLTPQE